MFHSIALSLKTCFLQKNEKLNKIILLFFFFFFYQHVAVTYIEGQILLRRHTETT